jgi:hypothetical protein
MDEIHRYQFVMKHKGVPVRTYVREGHSMDEILKTPEMQFVGLYCGWYLDKDSVKELEG